MAIGPTKGHQYLIVEEYVRYLDIRISKHLIKWDGESSIRITIMKGSNNLMPKGHGIYIEDDSKFWELVSSLYEQAGWLVTNLSNSLIFQHGSNKPASTAVEVFEEYIS
jgi:hypothetical protein